MGILKDFIAGLLLPFRAFGLILSRPSLMLLCIIPVIVAVGGYIYLWDSFFFPMREATLGWTKGFIAGTLGADSLSTMQSWMQAVLGFVITVLFALCTAFTFGWLCNLIALPFNDFIAEHAEKFTAPPIAIDARFDFSRFLSHMFIDLKKALLSGIVLLACFSVTWIPIMNIGAVIIAWLMLTFAFVSYPQTRRGIGVRDGLMSLIKTFPISLGFGCVLSLAFAIPIVSFIFLPLAIVGGTMLFAAKTG